MYRYLIAGVLAASTFSTLAGTRLPDTVVTASRIQENTTTGAFSTSVVAREAIEKSPARDVSELLRQLPGIQIGRNGGPGQATSIFLRGTASDHTLVLIDGVPVQSATTGATALQHIDPAVIERIEVVRGPASTLYGSSAIGGVIQIFTRRGAAQQPRMRASLKAGNEGSTQINSGISGGSGPFSASVQLSHQQTDGFPTRRASNIDRGYHHTSFNLQGSYEMGADAHLEIAHWQSQGNVEYLDFFNTPVDQDVLNSISRIALDIVPADRWDSRLQFSRAVDKSDENQSNDFAHTTRLAADWQNTLFPSEAHTLIAGLTWTRETAELSSFGSGYDKTSRSTELYFADNYRQGDLNLQAGVRGIHHSVYGEHLTWNLGAGYQLTSSTHLHASGGTAFRSPSANDLYGFGGNPDFQPEESRSIEFGLRQQLGTTQSLSLNLFHTRIDDLIEVNPNPPYATNQVEEARIRGVELGYRWHSGPWQADIAYTWQNPENLEQDTRLARRAENKLNARLGYDQGPWWSEIALTSETERLDSRFNNTQLAAYTTADLVAGYRFDKDWSTRIDVTNVFDKDYELAGGFPAQGRLIMLGLRYEAR